MTYIQPTDQLITVIARRHTENFKKIQSTISLVWLLIAMRLITFVILLALESFAVAEIGTNGIDLSKPANFNALKNLRIWERRAHLREVPNNLSIVGGESVPPVTHPYHAHITVFEPERECNGATITTRTVVSTAACLSTNTSGSDLFALVSFGGSIPTGKVWTRISHPGYNQQTFENDIALLISTLDDDVT